MREPLAAISLCAVAVAVASSCESPFEPRGIGERVPIGQLIDHAISSDSSDLYSFVAAPNELYVVFLESLRGNVSLIVSDSVQPYDRTGVNATPGGPSLVENASGTVGSPAGGVYQIRVSAIPPAHYRFVVYRIDQAPERVSARFAIGDTVTGESIDPIVDIDTFVAQGSAGQEIVTVVQALGLAGSVVLTVVDPITNGSLGYSVDDAGSSNQLTTGRQRLPGTHDYRFVVGSATYPRYHGTYRFWPYTIKRAPEHRPTSIPVNTEIDGERIDRAGDVDEFSFQGTAGADYSAFIQAAGPFQLEVAPATGPAFAAATAVGTDTALFAHGTNRFQIPQSGPYLLRLTGANGALVADTGAYRVYLYAIDRRPEHVPAAITPGDTISGEDIELPGDIDEYTFDGLAGEEFNVFLQAQNGSADTRLQLDVLNADGSVLRRAQSVGTDTSLLDQPGGRFALPATGTYRIRVNSDQSYGAASVHGRYRFLLSRIDRHPESLPDTLAFGDSVTGEAIDFPGDVDEFRVRVPDSSGANLAFEFLNQPIGGSLTVQLIDSANGQVLGSATAYTSGQQALGRMRLAAGTYIIRVDGNPYGDPSVLRGGYRLWMYRFGYGPEVARDTFAIGDTVSGESIEPWGDADQFHFYGVKGQHVNFMLQGLAAPSTGGFQAVITPPPSANAYLLFLTSGTAAAALTNRQTMRADLPGTGWYTFEVSGAGAGLEDRGPYRFTAVPLSAAPEHVSAALSVGDSVTAERIDAPGDWDEFTVTAPPGQDINIEFDGDSSLSGIFAWLLASDPANGDTLAYQVGQFRRMAGLFRVPASGQFTVAVFEPSGWSRSCYDASCGGIYRFVGPYGFHVIAVNRAPENNPSSYTIGDTVRGETIAPVGDIDEFSASGTPGEQLTLYDRLTVTASVDSAIVLEVIDPATGASLVGSGTAIFGSTFSPVGTFTVPASGAFIVRARVYGEWGFGVGTTSYEFFVSR